jgi:hypothetical protein
MVPNYRNLPGAACECSNESPRSICDKSKRAPASKIADCGAHARRHEGQTHD